MHEGIKTVEEFLNASPTIFPSYRFVSEAQINIGLDADRLPLFTIEAHAHNTVRIQNAREVWYCENDNIKSFLRGAAMVVRMNQPMNEWS